MSDYKNYLLRQMGLKEGVFEPKPDEEDPIKDMENQSSAFGKMLSPTAKSTPIIGLAVRGSSTGGLPSGATPAKMGGYAPVNLEKSNSELVHKTPKTSVIQNGEPKVPEGSMPTTPSSPHPHQVQKNSDAAPQKVTGGQETVPDDLKLKNAAPKSIDIDVQEADADKVSDDRLKNIAESLSAKGFKSKLSQKESILLEKVNALIKARRK